MGILFRILFLQELTLALPVAGALYPNNDRVVEDTIQYRAGRDRVTEDPGPVLLLDVGCKDQGFVILVALIDHLEQQMCFFDHL